jgi:hypothetical protein
MRPSFVARAFLASLVLTMACSKSEDANHETPSPAPIDTAAPDGALPDAGSTDAAPVSTPTADALLLDEIQKTTFRFFWDFGHPDSGMARERSTSGNITTTGGTGFGLQAIVVATSRGWVTRTDAVARTAKIVGFLETADRFHGAWSHWVHGTTGKVVPFSAKDNGGDIVESTLLLAGLLTARAYFDGAGAEEVDLRSRITTLWEGVDFAWYVHNGAIFWHWSPTFEWQMNLPIRGWNEALITYVLALGSPAHPIAQQVYDQSWTHAAYKNDNVYDGYQLPLGPPSGGPLFFAHYSFLGLDPRKMADSFAGYWYQNTVHTRINRAYCVSSAPAENGYGPELWGLTASDNPDGYAAHSPTNDNGTIAPTAALSSMPYTPHESLQVARHLKTLGPKVFGQYGFVDAFNPKRNWYDEQVIAIDQGPIIVMIENYRSGLIWKLMMSVPEVRSGLSKAKISDPDHATGFYLAVPDAGDKRVHLVRHPDRGEYELDIAIHDAGAYSLVVTSTSAPKTVWSEAPQTKGTQVVKLGPLTPGSYDVRLEGGGVTKTLPIVLH